MLVTIKNNTTMTIAFSAVQTGEGKGLVLEGKKTAYNINIEGQEPIRELNSLASKDFLEILEQKEYLDEYDKKEFLLIKQEEKDNKEKDNKEKEETEKAEEIEDLPPKKKGRPKKTQSEKNAKTKIVLPKAKNKTKITPPKEKTNKELDETENKSIRETSTICNPENSDLINESIKAEEIAQKKKEKDGVKFIDHKDIAGDEPENAKTIIFTKDGAKETKTKTPDEIFAEDFQPVPEVKFVEKEDKKEDDGLDFLEL